MSFSLRVILSFAWVFVAVSMLPQAGYSEDYNYPYPDPFLATFSSGLLKGRTQKQGVPSEIFKVNVISGRDDYKYMDGRGYMSCRLYRQKNKAPLMIVVPGLGANAHIGNGTFLGDLFYEKGFHVLVVPSPLNWNFALSASESGLPGVTSEDVGDLYHALKLAIQKLKDDEKLEIGKIGMIGLSLGGLETAFFAALEEQKQEIGISRYLLLSPAVDLGYGIHKIDSMAAMINEAGGPAKAMQLMQWVMGQLVDSILDGDPEDPNYFRNVDKRFPFSDPQLQFLMGNMLKDPVSEAIYVSQVINDRHLLKSDPDIMSRRIAEAKRFSLFDYVEKFLFPRYQERNVETPVTIEELMQRSSLRAVLPMIKDNPKIFVMENEDDFLLHQDDIPVLKAAFGSRMTTYPHGGHLGNIWFPRNKDDIRAVFSDLIQN